MAAFCKIASLEVTSAKFCAVKCNLMELTTKSACVPGSKQNQCIMYVHMLDFHMLVYWSVAPRRCFFWRFTIALVWQLIAQAVPFPPLSHCFDSMAGFGSQGSTLRRRNWLPIVEAPGCPGHQTSILVLQLLKASCFFNFFLSVVKF